MSFLNSLYQKSVADNERNIRFWEDYLKNLKSLDFGVYAEKLKVPTLVPIGSRVFFRGELKHTSEVTIALGADYFVKCSLAQAEVLRQHRIKDAESKVHSFQKEKEFLENQFSLTHKSIYEKDGKEIVEVLTEDEDIEWRLKHRENVRKYKQGQAKEEKPKEDITDEELWNRLEELELEEELENELLDNYNEIVDKRKENSFLIKEEQMLLNTSKIEKSKTENNKTNPELGNDKLVSNKKTHTVKDKNIKENENEHTSKFQLLQKVLDKQNQLEDKLSELKNRERQPSKSEKDLMSHLDEMDQLDELEDEMDRLDDILDTEDIDSDDEDSKSSKISTKAIKLKKSISFADEIDDTSETIEINFKHSDVEPLNEPYDPEKGILKPSDIYEAHTNLFITKPTSILKKSKYDDDSLRDIATPGNENLNIYNYLIETYQAPVKETIIVKDVVENSDGDRAKINTEVRPTSLFKQRRMQNKR